MSRYWLMKSEPGVYSIDDLERDGETHWDGIRNYQARNFMRDEMRVGDKVLFYHSNASPPGIVGIAQVSREAYPDFTSWDPKSPYHDKKSTEDNPRWFMVDVEFVEKFPRTVALPEIKESEALQDMVLVKRSRLSVLPVKKQEFETIVQMAYSGDDHSEN